MADNNAKFGAERGAGYINITREDFDKCAKFVKIWNEKPEKKTVDGEEKRFTLAEYAGFEKQKNDQGKTVMVKTQKGAFDEFLTPATKLEQLRAKANEIRGWKDKNGKEYQVKMREVQSLSQTGRRAFVIAWESSETLHEVLEAMVKSKHVECDLTDAEDCKDMKQSLKNIAKALIQKGLPLKQDFMKSNGKRIPADTLIAVCNSSKNWAEVLEKLIDLELCDDSKKTSNLKIQAKNIIEAYEKEGKENPFKTLDQFTRTPRYNVDSLKDLLASLRGGAKVEVPEASEDNDGEENSEENSEEENDAPAEKEEMDDVAAAAASFMGAIADM